MDYKSRKKARQIVTAAVLLVFIIIAVLSALGKTDDIYSAVGLNKGKVTPTDDFVRVIDVGQGDSILICSNGRSALIDTGDGTTDICSKLRSYGIREIDALLISHIHTDHTGGFDDIASRLTVDNLIMPDFGKTDENVKPVNTVVRSVLAEDGEMFTAKQGMNFCVGDFEITVIGYYTDAKDENNRSVIVMAEIDGRRFLFTGDAESNAETRLLEDGINVDCDVLKVGHHGSSYSCSKDFLKSCTPEYAAISCGAGNQYSHPHDVTLSRLSEAGVDIYRTDLNGDITFYVDNGKITVDTEK